MEIKGCLTHDPYIIHTNGSKECLRCRQVVSKRERELEDEVKRITQLWNTLNETCKRWEKMFAEREEKDA